MDCEKGTEIARFTPVEYHEYEDSLKAYRDMKNSLDTAHWEERVEIVKKDFVLPQIYYNFVAKLRYIWLHKVLIIR